MRKPLTSVLIAFAWSAIIVAMALDENVNWIAGMATGSWMTAWSIWIWWHLHGK